MRRMPKTSMINILSPNYEYIKGKDAWRDNLRTTVLAAERICTSLGPNGAYKLVTYNRGPERIVKITRDAVPVLEELAIQYPTLVVFSEAAKIQRRDVGDGVASFVIFTSALLKKADELITKGIHPTVILEGYAEAEKKAQEMVSANSRKIGNYSSEETLKIADCGRGLLTPDICSMILRASKRAENYGRLDKDRVRFIRKPGGNPSDTCLVHGLVIKKAKLHPNMPDCVLKPRIALTSARIGISRMEVKMPGQGPFHFKFNVDNPGDLQSSKTAESSVREQALENLRLHGANVLFCQQPIDDLSKSRLVNMGLLAFASVDRGDLALISKATDAKIVSNLNDLTKLDIGEAKRIDIEKLALEKTVTLICPNYSTFVLRGSTPQTLDEQEEIISKALKLIKITQKEGDSFLPGGGATETQIAQELKAFANHLASRKQLAIDAFADALLEIPRCLSRNNGLNPIDTMTELYARHAEGLSNYGAGFEGCQPSVCMEPAEVKRSVIKRACEMTTLMLRVDEQVASKEIVKFHKKQ